MRGVAQLGQAYSVSVIDLPMPAILNETDAIVHINASAICGSDLHYYHQPLGSPEHPFLLGHEAIGYVTKIGAAVQFLSVGDYVVIPDNIGDGHFTYSPDMGRFFSGPQGSGALGGLQAEYARVPFADNSLIPVPVNHDTDPSTLHDYLFVSDIFSTGWSALDLAGFTPGDTVAIFGAGPVGLLAAYSAQLRGASRVYSIDQVQDRLRIAENLGSIPINFREFDPVDKILAMESGGVARGVDAVGFEAVDAGGHVNASIVLSNLVRVVASKGGIGIVGVYYDGDVPNFDVGRVFTHGLTIRGAAAVLPLQHARELVSLITAGRASPSFVVSKTISIEEVPEYYARFDRREESKVVINMP